MCPTTVASHVPPPWRLRIFFRYTLKQVVWFGLVLCQTLNLAFCSASIVSGYNGACAKVNVVFTARRYALARSLLSSGVRRPFDHHVRALHPDG